jgi:2-keto-4-pentenoate hydratase
MIDIDAIARSFHAALEAGAQFDPPSGQSSLDLDQAYAVQRAFNRLRARDDAVAGFKAGINAERAQRALGLEGPVVGALFSSGERRAGATVRRADYCNLVIETELGFRAGRRIDKPFASVDDVVGAIATVAPMFELADPRFGTAPIRGTDMIAANLACGGFVEGPRRPLAGFDLNSVALRLTREGELLHEARSTDLLGDHWQALRWLVGTLLARGEIIEAGQLLMTGALGPAQPAVPGRYRAEFSTLGAVEIVVV